MAATGDDGVGRFRIVPRDDGTIDIKTPVGAPASERLDVTALLSADVDLTLIPSFAEAIRPAGLIVPESFKEQLGLAEILLVLDWAEFAAPPAPATARGAEIGGFEFIAPATAKWPPDVITLLPGSISEPLLHARVPRGYVELPGAVALPGPVRAVIGSGSPTVLLRF